MTPVRPPGDGTKFRSAIARTKRRASRLLDKDIREDGGKSRAVRIGKGIANLHGLITRNPGEPGRKE